jgi:cytidine deaminase
LVPDVLFELAGDLEVVRARQPVGDEGRLERDDTASIGEGLADVVPDTKLATGGNYHASGSVVSDVMSSKDAGHRIEIDWPHLRAQATRAARNAYAPYSGLSVGAAGLVADGRVFIGCNVENASYGLTLCAECGLVSSIVAAGAEGLLALAIVARDGRPLMPCGRCRQLLVEHGTVGLLLDRGDGEEPVMMRDLLPAAWRGPEDVPSTRAPSAD